MLGNDADSLVVCMVYNSAKKFLCRYKATLSYILLIVVLNKLYGNAPLYTFFQELVSPLDITVGMIYIFRDFAQREIGRSVIIAMLLAGFLSFVMAEQAVAYASLCAFLMGEFIDWGIFTYTNKPLSQRLLWSAMLSAPVDSFAFLFLLGRANWLAVGVMTLTKFMGVVVVWMVWRWQDRKKRRASTANSPLITS
jgi:uncharacterized PurR-regulated membrane protein YhhQ (DUF165 family)